MDFISKINMNIQGDGDGEPKTKTVGADLDSYLNNIKI